MIQKALKMIEQFLNGDYDSETFSFDFPDFLCENFEQLKKENEAVADVLNDELPDICAWYDWEPMDEGCVTGEAFRQKIKVEYDRARALV